MKKCNAPGKIGHYFHLGPRVHPILNPSIEAIGVAKITAVFLSWLNEELPPCSHPALPYSTLGGSVVYGFRYDLWMPTEPVCENDCEC